MHRGVDAPPSPGSDAPSPTLPFRLDVHGGPYPGYAAGVQWGAAYALFTAGRPVRLGAAMQPYVGPARPDDAAVTVSILLDEHGRFAGVRAPRIAAPATR